MNPVQQITKSGYDFQNVKDNILSINLMIDGLSFVIIDGEIIVKAETYKWQKKDWSYALEQFKAIFLKQLLLKNSYKKTFVFIKNQESTLIPNDLYSESNNNLILETLLGLEKESFISISNKLTNAEIILLFALSKELGKLINSTFPTATIIHQSSIFIDEAIKNSIKNEKLYLNIGQQSFEVVALKNSKITAHNYFNFTTVDEFMFFLLSFVKQNYLSLEKLQLCIGGKITMDSRIGVNLKKYFLNIEQVKTTISNEKDVVFEQLKNYTIIANS